MSAVFKSPETQMYNPYNKLLVHFPFINIVKHFLYKFYFTKTTNL